MKKLRVGVIGLGMGRGHVKGYQSHPAAEVVAVADVDEARLAERADALSVPSRYTDAQAMLDSESLDVVSVATPNKYHMPLTIAALEAGCHVLCEKPMAMNAQEAERMIAAANKAGRRLMINFSYRFSDQSQALKAQVDRGVLGEVYFAKTTWHRRRGMPGFGGWFGQKQLAGGGPLIDLGVHRIDLALWLMGYPKPVWVMGRTFDHLGKAAATEQQKKFDVEDLAVGMIQFDNGSVLEVEASWAAHIAERELMETRLLGTKAGLVQRNRNETYEFEAELYYTQDGAHYDQRLHAAATLNRNAMSHFIEAIATDTPHTATAEEGLTVMRILDAIYQSAEKGEPIKVG